jgi:thiamine-phosphate pyrophosphorylase
VVRKIRERVCGLKPLRRSLYLISPNKINQNFYNSLDKVLSFNNVNFFQLRLKNVSQKKIINISKKIRRITVKHKVKFIINDNYTLVSKIKANGCHMGQQDGSFKIVRKKLKGKILGITCHNSKVLANKAIDHNADYIAFGSFFRSRLKPDAKKANLNILKWAKKNIKKPIVVIGGINNINYKRLIKAGAKYIALSSFIWDNPKLKPEQAIRKFK